jgi:hypothetical protein
MVETGEKNRKGRVVKSLPMAFEEDDFEALRDAYYRLEHPSLAARLSNVVGTPIDLAIQLLPKPWYRRFHKTAEAAIAKALETAVSSMRREKCNSAHENYYKTLVAGSGAIGGLFGLPGLLLELPISTTLIIRGIAEIARDEGEDVHSTETQLACIEVFALGGTAESDDAAESGYYGIRFALSTYMTAAVSHVAAQGFKADGGPVMIQLISAIASRFGVAISQRAAIQIMPVVSAVSAATVNTIFMQHFQDMARAHFTVRRLERKYGEAFVRAGYETLREQA